MKIAIASLLLFCTSMSFAGTTSPEIDPGPIVKLSNESIEVVDAMLLAKPADLQSFIKSGNQTREISRQYVKPGVTSYNFTRQQCIVGGFAGGTCLGGSTLQVVITETRMGSMVKVAAVSRVILIK